MLQILIADDHAIVRAGLKQILVDYPNLEVTEAADGLEALNLLRKRSFDVVLLDLSMPGRDGLEVLADIKREFPDIRVLILSMHPEEQYAVRSLKAGASGYVTKEAAPQELVEAVLKIANGGKYITKSLAEQFLDLLAVESNPPHTALSNREFEIFRMIASGKTASEIAQHLSLSVKTISTYRARILQKMHLKNNAQIIFYAVHNRLI